MSPTSDQSPLPLADVEAEGGAAEEDGEASLAALYAFFVFFKGGADVLVPLPRPTLEAAVDALELGLFKLDVDDMLEAVAPLRARMAPWRTALLLRGVDVAARSGGRTGLCEKGQITLLASHSPFA